MAKKTVRDVLSAKEGTFHECLQKIRRTGDEEVRSGAPGGLLGDGALDVHELGLAEGALDGLGDLRDLLASGDVTGGLDGLLSSPSPSSESAWCPAAAAGSSA